MIAVADNAKLIMNIPIDNLNACGFLSLVLDSMSSIFLEYIRRISMIMSGAPIPKSRFR